MLDHAPAFDDLDAHVLSSPGRNHPAPGPPLRAGTRQRDRADAAWSRRAWFGGGAPSQGPSACVRAADADCRLGFPETPLRVRHGGDRVALLSALIVVCDLQDDSAVIHDTTPGDAGGLWISLPRRALAVNAAVGHEHGASRAVASTTLAAWLPRDLFVAQRLLYFRLRSATDVPAGEVLRHLEALGRRVAFVDIDACDLTSAELVSPIAEGLGQISDRADFVDRVQRAAGISRRSVFRAFRQRVGMPAHQLGMELRARRAFDLLCDRRLPVGAIVAQLGYASQSHFCSHFKAAFGISPGRLQDALDDPLRLRSLQALLNPHPIGRPAWASNRSVS